MPFPFLVIAAFTVLIVADEQPTKMSDVALAEDIAQEVAAAEVGVKAVNLIVPVLNGRNLPGKDRHTAPDAYVRLKATDAKGETETQESSTIWNSKNPDWYEVIVFEPNDWFLLEAQVFDSDWLGDDQLSDTVTIFLTKSTENCDVVIPTTGGGNVTIMYLVQ